MAWLQKAFAGLAVIVLSAGTAAAQFPYPGYYPPPGYGGFGPGNVMRGQADLLRAQGEVTVDIEKARVEREKANQAKMDTKKKAFDEMMYEKANTPTFAQEQAKITNTLLQRILTNPNETEILSGKAQNIIMPYLRNMAELGVQGPPVKLDSIFMKEINVTTGKKDSLGPLRNVGQLEWPLSLYGKEQEKLANSLTMLVSEAVNGYRIDPKLYRQVQASLTTVQDEARNKWLKEEIDSAGYLAAKRFLEPLEESIKALQAPGAMKFLDGTYAAKGDTVPELMNYMTSQGLKFAPYVPGGENAYHALYHSMVAYANGAANGSGFQVRLAPPGFSGDPWAKYKN